MRFGALGPERFWEARQGRGRCWDARPDGGPDAGWSIRGSSGHRRERDDAVGEREHRLDGGELLTVQQEGGLLCGGGQLPRRRWDRRPEAVVEVLASVFRRQRRTAADAGEDGTGGAGVAVERAPSFERGQEALDSGGFAATDGEQDVREFQRRLEHEAVRGW